MIELARRQEVQHRLGINFLVGDARHLHAAEPYDLVVAAYLLNYAEDRATLEAMCQGIARCLKPGAGSSRSTATQLWNFQPLPPIANTGLKRPRPACGGAPDRVDLSSGRWVILDRELSSERCHSRTGTAAGRFSSGPLAQASSVAGGRVRRRARLLDELLGSPANDPAGMREVKTSTRRTAIGAADRQGKIKTIASTTPA